MIAMLNAWIVRYCQQCGVYPVTGNRKYIGKICDVCFLRAISEAMIEPFRCPRCETVQELGDGRFVCPHCNYVEELDD